MTLREWLSTKEITQAQFAKTVGVTRECVSWWVNGNKFPSQNIQRIVEVTGGEVTANDFYGLN